ncbi:MAG: universal stress protein, partial [Gemmatimonadetes bacterium]|nr:universal stress protein [Gemmatimonadota bacterium]
PQAIAEYARTHEVDLIAMSSHGRTGFRHLVLGSVSEAVIRHADRPVLVFPRGE